MTDLITSNPFYMLGCLHQMEVYNYQVGWAIRYLEDLGGQDAS